MGVPVEGIHIIGNERAVTTLARAAASIPVHAYLLVGPARVGKRTLALEFAMALNCERSIRPCHACYACHKIASGNHPDVATIEPIDGRETISVEQVRELRESAILRPYEGVWRVFLIVADTLTGGAADALLKMLEEPPPQMVLVLIARDLEGLAETIVSRCQVITLNPVPAAVIAHALEEHGAAPGEARRLAELAHGAPGWALEALANPMVVADRERVLERMSSLATLSLSDRLVLIEEITSGAARAGKERGLLRQYLEVLLEWWRDVLLVCGGHPELVTNRTRLAELERQAQQQALDRVYCVLRAIVTAMVRIDQNVDPRLALEALVTSIEAIP
jgi:DNA polymerase-3 subunit delta'